ncbi:MAG: hypothetical protein CL472_09265 [Acidobacteria bacterium]|nr:hypothetical protein [Acidobacteriota bacterium]
MMNPDARILIPDADGSHTIGHQIKMMLDATASIKDDAWLEHPEVGDRRTIYAPISDTRLIIFRIERSAEPNRPDGIITSMEINTSPSLNEPAIGIILEPLLITLDFNSMTGPDIASAMRNLTVIDHENLDAFPALPERTRHASPSARIHQAMINALYHSLSPAKRKDQDDSARFYRTIEDGTWTLTVLGPYETEAIKIDPSADILNHLPPIIRVGYASAGRNIIAISEAHRVGVIVRNDPPQIMEWISALSALTNSIMPPAHR